MARVVRTHDKTDQSGFSLLETISYQLLSVNGTFSLQRQEDSNDAQPVATNVRSLTIAYYNDANTTEERTVPLTIRITPRSILLAS